jgi:L-ribulose-5-phosphate 3-epimerase
MNRRAFVKKSAITASVFPFIDFPFSISTSNQSIESPLSVHVFSKVLQFMDCYQAAEMTAEMGFAGLDLTVRPKGHVLPQNVAADLPTAMGNIKKGGSTCTMITTAVSSVNNPIDVSVLEAASKENIKLYRPDWFKYIEGISMQDSLLNYQEEIRKLSLLNQKLGIAGSYQNHDGITLGSSFWEIEAILQKVKTTDFGSQYDIRHAMVEGGYSWKNGFKLLQPKMNSLVLKDFKWEKGKSGWKAINTPIGEGMVDFDSFFKLLKQNQMNLPVSMHFEYDLGGAEKGFQKIAVDKKVVFNALKKDLEMVQKLWSDA